MIEQRREFITPQTAELYLGKNVDNRVVKRGVVERYTADMRNGRWTDCMASIVFDVDGRLIDGQHRLLAIIASGKSFPFFVTRNAPPECRMNIDVGSVRTFTDNARMSGADPEGKMTREFVALCKAIESGTKSSHSSHGERLDVVKEHGYAADWAMKYGPRLRKSNNVRYSLTLSAIARAFVIEEDTLRLARFGEVLDTGHSVSASESAAVSMRNQLLAHPVRTGEDWRDSFLRMQNAIHYFMRGEPLRVVRPTSEERYPLVVSRKTRPLFQKERHACTTRSSSL